MTLSMVELIRAKRDGGSLTDNELAWIIREYTADQIPDYQLSALLMAIVFNGMTADELSAWTEAMLHSGKVLDLTDLAIPKIDKHSTGGVGDKISIPLVPIVASCGVAVPMISGRGLGHTGGTLDKLESIPGFTVDIDPSAFVDQLADIGMVMAGQSETLVPADRRIYALRDATGTVPSIPLIASSIMSKKLAEDLDGLLLDVKVGAGAFMKTVGEATDLAHTMVSIGARHRTRVTAILTNMDQPLGQAVGNANEIQESIAILRGEGPPDVRELTLAFAAEMLVLSGIADHAKALRAAENAISSGRALEMMILVTERQGGDPATIEDPSLLEIAPHTFVIEAETDGWVTACDAYAIGTAGVRLGGGRATKEDVVDPGVGFSIDAKIGDYVTKGQPLARIAYRDTAKLKSALAASSTAWEISPNKPAIPPLIIETIR
ncbi:MAG: thymidine phosphorylase [Actinomycetia bacterium]|nr:thymidine phosphorylase [Actinomycetes bacterium]